MKRKALLGCIALTGWTVSGCALDSDGQGYQEELTSEGGIVETINDEHLRVPSDLASPTQGVASSINTVRPNLAAGKAATQSSTPWEGVEAARAVDGDWNPSSVTHTDWDAQAWWRVDLGAVTAIAEIVLYNRTDCCGERLANADVLFSRDGFTWTLAGRVGAAPLQRIAFSLQASGRFVSVRLPGTNYLSLGEVQVFATPPDGGDGGGGGGGCFEITCQSSRECQTACDEPTAQCQNRRCFLP